MISLEVLALAGLFAIVTYGGIILEVVIIKAIFEYIDNKVNTYFMIRKWKEYHKSKNQSH